jgi:hypothetical protein
VHCAALQCTAVHCSATGTGLSNCSATGTGLSNCSALHPLYTALSTLPGPTTKKSKNIHQFLLYYLFVNDINNKYSSIKLAFMTTKIKEMLLCRKYRP